MYLMRKLIVSVSFRYDLILCYSTAAHMHMPIILMSIIMFVLM